MLLFIVPREQWTMLDDWGRSLGLKGSGSHSIQMDRARVPAHFVLENHWLVDSDPSGNPGYRIHGNPLYVGRTLAIFQAGLTALAVGGARGMLDSYEQQIRNRNTQRPPIRPRYQDPDYQLWYGRAIGRVAAAEAALIGLLKAHAEICRSSAEDGVPYTREHDLMLNAVAREALTLAWTAVQDDLFRTGGSSAAMSGERLERIYRDVSMNWSHFGNTLRDWTARELAHEHLGLLAGPAPRPDRVHTAAR
jgi:3-hydroxy-9,10-secoandrosta-1,3,5(10)-triene-9,17-dione monooxygenase